MKIKKAFDLYKKSKINELEKELNKRFKMLESYLDEADLLYEMEEDWGLEDFSNYVTEVLDRN